MTRIGAAIAVSSSYGGEAVRLDLPEYKQAFDTFTDEVVKGVIRSHGLLGEMYSHRTIHAGPVRHVGGENPLDHAMTRVEHKMTIHVDVIRDTDIDAFCEEFLKTPAAVVDQLMQAFVRQFEDITERTGQVIDAGGRPFDFDQWLAMLETWDLRFDEAGNPELDNMIILAGPGVQISPPQPASHEQEQRFAQLIQRKRAAYNATKRTRRLH